MNAPNRPKPRIIFPSPDGPPRPTSVDIIIGNHNGSTVALNATSEQLQASKRLLPTLSERIEELSVENGYIRREILYYQQLHDAMRVFQDDATQALEMLRRALSKFGKVQRQVDDDWSQMQSSESHRVVI